MKYFRDFGDLSSDSIVTDLYNRRIKDNKKGKPKKHNAWVKPKHKNKQKPKGNKALIKENEELHRLQTRLKTGNVKYIKYK